jgi:hypothetical protein
MQNSPDSKSSSPSSSISAAAVRVFWMIVGTGFLIGLSLYIATNPGKSILVPSCLYVLNLVCMMLMRYIDIRFLNGQTVDGEPATMQHWARYSIFLSGIAAALWGAALLLSHFKIL